MSGHDDERWRELAAREALGEPLSADERALQRAHEAIDPAAAAESAAFGALVEHLRRRAAAPLADADADALIERALAEVRAAPRVELAARRPSRARLGLGVGVGLAAAAAIAGLWVASRPSVAPVIAEVATPAPRPTPAADRTAAAARERPPAPVKEPVLVAMSSGPGLIGHEVTLAVGATIEEGAVIDAVGEGCLLFRDPLAAVCLDAGARVTIELARASERRLTLARGRLLATLDPLPPGGAFEVVTAGGSARAVGTVFAVQVDQGAGDVGVLEGKVELRRPGASPRRLVAAEHAALDGASIEPLPAGLAEWAGPRSALVELWRGADLATLALTAAERGAPASLALDGLALAPATAAILVPPGAHRLIAARPGRADAVAEVDAIAGGRVDLIVPAGPRGKVTAPGSTASPDPADLSDPVADLRRAAGEARAAGRWADAAAAYQSLLDRYPDAPEAHNARVQLGDLLRGRLGDPAGALVHYLAYLDRGGPLDAEARHGLILCLQRLGRADEERAAIAEFLARHPRHLEADKLRRRADELVRP